MKIKIIKRREQKKIKEKTLITESSQPEKADTQRAMATTINFWIEDLRQKRERERLSVKKLFTEFGC